ncbi:MAG TPA: hypothetical protein VE860_21645, partial [Chthoniobacterales bacterium]|nr:hypothetical protein [Chthoniobacterales bacterium]
PQPQTIKKKPRMNTNEHELDGSIRVHWCPFVVRKFLAKLREVQSQKRKGLKDPNVLGRRPVCLQFFVLLRLNFAAGVPKPFPGTASPAGTAFASFANFCSNSPAALRPG